MCIRFFPFLSVVERRHVELHLSGNIWSNMILSSFRLIDQHQTLHDEEPICHPTKIDQLPLPQIVF